MAFIEKSYNKLEPRGVLEGGNATCSGVRGVKTERMQRYALNSESRTSQAETKTVKSDSLGGVLMMKHERKMVDVSCMIDEEEANNR